MNVLTTNLLLAAADTRRPTLSRDLRVDGETLPRPRDGRNDETLRGDPMADPNDLARQRWGLVVPEGAAGDALLARVRRLREAREEEQGAAALEYRVPEGMDANAAQRWVREVYLDEERPERERPRFLLLLGDADQVSMELQLALSAEAFPGRLALAEPGALEAYVEKALWRPPRPPPPTRALLYTAHDGSSAAEAGWTGLVEPSLRRLCAAKKDEALPLGAVEELGDPFSPGADDLLRPCAEATGDILLTLSHGVGAPRGGWSGRDTMVAEQGALVLGKDLLRAPDLEGAAFLSHGFWLCVSCFGLGTPSESSFYPWLERLAASGEWRGLARQVLASLEGVGGRGFLAELPRAALASPRGPLAFLGHLDLTWTCSFQEAGGAGQSRSSRFSAVIEGLAKGARAGVATAALTRHFASANTALTNLYERSERAQVNGRPDPVSPLERAQHWMQRQDLAGWALLGDPAVRLPGAGAATAPAPRLEPARAVELALPTTREGGAELEAVTHALVERIRAGEPVELVERTSTDGSFERVIRLTGGRGG